MSYLPPSTPSDLARLSRRLSLRAKRSNLDGPSGLGSRLLRRPDAPLAMTTLAATNGVLSGAMAFLRGLMLSRRFTVAVHDGQHSRSSGRKAGSGAGGRRRPADRGATPPRQADRPRAARTAARSRFVRGMGHVRRAPQP